MIKFDEERVLLIHQLLSQETGGSVGVRDRELLESALEGVYQTFDGKELFPSKEEKGARLGFSLIRNHAFVDGNKRIGMHIMLAFLELNGIPLDCTDDEIISMGLSLAAGETGYDELLRWIYAHEVWKKQ